MRITRQRQGRGKGIGPAAHRLVVYSRGLPGSLRWKPVAAIVVAEGKLAGHKVELRGKHPIRSAKMSVVNEQDRVQAHARKRRTLVLPKSSGRIDAVIEGHSQRMISGFDERFAGVPVNPNGRFSSAVLPGSR